MKITGMKAVVAGVKLGPSGGRAAATFKVDVLASEGTREGAALKEHAPEIGPLQRHALERQLTSDKKDREELLIDGKRFGLGEHSLKLWALPAEARGEKCAPLLDVTATLGKKVRVFIGPAEAKVRFDLVVGTGHLASVTVRELEALIEAEGWFDLAELQTTLDEAPKAKKRGRKKNDAQLPLAPSTAAPPAPAGATGFGALAESRKRVERDVAPADSAPQEPPPETRVCVVAPDVDLGFDPVGMSERELAHDLREKTRGELVAIARELHCDGEQSGGEWASDHGALADAIAARLCDAQANRNAVEETENTPSDGPIEELAAARAGALTVLGSRAAVGGDEFTDDPIPWGAEANAATPAADPATTKRHARAMMLLAAHPSHLHVPTHAMESDVEDTLAPLPDADVLGYFLLIAGRQPTEAEGASLRAEVARLIGGGAVAPVEPATTAKPGVTVRRRKAKGAGAETWSDAVAASAEAPVVVPSVVPDLPVDLSLGFDPTMLTLEELEVEVTALSSDKLRVVHRQLTGSVPKGKAEETVKTVLGRLRMHARRDSASASA